MRRKDREVTDAGALEDIIARGKVCRVAYADEEGMTIVPLSYGYSMEEGTLTLYFHSAKEGRKVRAFTRGVEAAFEIDGAMRIIEGETACSYGCTFESIVGSGRGSCVTDEDEKMRALSLLMQNQTGRTFEFTQKETQGVAILKIEARHFTGKRRDA